MKDAIAGRTPGLIRKRDAWLRKLAGIGPMTRGSLCTARRGGHVAHQLTVSVNGKTHTVYVPLDMVEEVQTWIRNHRQLRKILRKVSKLNMAIIHRHIPESQVGDRPRGNRRRNPWNCF